MASEEEMKCVCCQRGYQGSRQLTKLFISLEERRYLIVSIRAAQMHLMHIFVVVLMRRVVLAESESCSWKAYFEYLSETFRKILGYETPPHYPLLGSSLNEGKCIDSAKTVKKRSLE